VEKKFKRLNRNETEIELQKYAFRSPGALRKDIIQDYYKNDIMENGIQPVIRLKKRYQVSFRFKFTADDFVPVTVKMADGTECQQSGK
jgi:hypothetical protein